MYLIYWNFAFNTLLAPSTGSCHLSEFKSASGGPMNTKV